MIVELNVLAAGVFADKEDKIIVGDVVVRVEDVVLDVFDADAVDIDEDVVVDVILVVIVDFVVNDVSVVVEVVEVETVDDIVVIVDVIVVFLHASHAINCIVKSYVSDIGKPILWQTTTVIRSYSFHKGTPWAAGSRNCAIRCS